MVRPRVRDRGTPCWCSLSQCGAVWCPYGTPWVLRQRNATPRLGHRRVRRSFPSLARAGWGDDRADRRHDALQGSSPFCSRLTTGQAVGPASAILPQEPTRAAAGSGRRDGPGRLQLLGVDDRPAAYGRGRRPQWRTAIAPPGSGTQAGQPVAIGQRSSDQRRHTDTGFHTDTGTVNRFDTKARDAHARGGDASAHADQHHIGDRDTSSDDCPLSAGASVR